MPNEISDFCILHCKYVKNQARSQLSDNGGGSFSSDFDVFQGLKVGVSSGCLGQTFILKIQMIDDVTMWSKIESTW